METTGGETSEALTCPRDGVETRLKCPDCRTPICPSCFVRTPVGLKCEECAAPVPAAAAFARRSRRTRFVIAAVAVITVAAGAWALFGRPGTGGSTDDRDLGIPARGETAAGPVVASGTGPDGVRWVLEARRDERNRICSRLAGSRGSPSRESCDVLPTTRRPFGPPRTRASFNGGNPTFQTWMLVSEQAERVRTTTEDGTTTEEPTIAPDTGLGARFFVSYVDRLQAVTFVALGANGEELGRVNPAPLPPPPGR